MNVDKGLIRHWANLCEGEENKMNVVDEEWSDEKYQRIQSDGWLRHAPNFIKAKEMVKNDETGYLIDLLIYTAANKEGYKIFDSFVKVSEHQQECREFAKVIGWVAKSTEEFLNGVNGDNDIPQDEVYEDKGDNGEGKNEEPAPEPEPEQEPKKEGEKPVAEKEEEPRW